MDSKVVVRSVKDTLEIFPIAGSRTAVLVSSFSTAPAPCGSASDWNGQPIRRRRRSVISPGHIDRRPISSRADPYVFDARQVVTGHSASLGEWQRWIRGLGSPSSRSVIVTFESCHTFDTTSHASTNLASVSTHHRAKNSSQSPAQHLEHLAGAVHDGAPFSLEAKTRSLGCHPAATNRHRTVICLGR